MIDLMSRIEGFDTAEDCETDVAYFRTRIFWQGPGSYFHVIYKPLSEEYLWPVLQRLDAPSSAYDLLKVHNGAHLFAGSLHIYGAWKPGQLLPEDLHERATFDLKIMNRETDQSLGLAIGCYPDGAVAILDRDTEKVTCWLEDPPVYRWDSVDQWLTNECDRLRMCFDRNGCLVRSNSKPFSPRTGAVRPNERPIR